METAVITSSTAQTISESFPFLALPAEIRNQIYLALLTNTLFVSSSHYRSWTSEMAKPTTVHTQILRSSRQVHEEASTILYTVNKFQAHPTFLISLPFLSNPSRTITAAAYVSLIRRFHLCVRLDCDPYWTDKGVADAFSGLDEFEVEAWQSSFGTSGTRVLEGFATIRDVRKARVSGCVGKGFARWLEGVMESSRSGRIEVWAGGRWDVWENGNR